MPDSIEVNRRIEAMYREKNARIARQVALKAAVDVVCASEHSRLEHPEKIMRRVLIVADEFYKWLNEVEGKI